MKLTHIIRIILTLLIYLALTFYIGWNAHIWLATVFGFQNDTLVLALTFFLAFSYVFARFAKSVSLFRLMGSYWFGLIQYAILILPLGNLVYYVMVLTGLSRDYAITITGWGVLLTFLIIFGFGTFNAYSPVVRRHEVVIEGKNAKQKEITIAVASDMHFGHLSGRKHARRLVTEMNELQPDLILFPGDIIDDDPDPFIAKGFGGILSGLRAPLGVYGVLGNHEYYGGKVPTYLEEMNRIEIPILMDEVKEIEGLLIVGRKDKTDRNRVSMAALLSPLDHEKPIIVMDHQPLELGQAAENGADIIVSGHTHRGQMAPNHLITKRIFELDWGYLKKQRLHAFVSSGYGFWGPPLRIGSRSEIVCIHVTFQ